MKLQHPISHHDFFLLRSPIVSVEKIFDLNKTTETGDLSIFDKALRDIYADKLLQEALYIASPDFYAEFEKWLNQPNQKPNEEILLTLYKYYIRMSTRPTPYGLFAGCAVGNFSDKTEIQFSEQNKYHKHSRLDMNYVAELAKFITAQPQVKECLKFFPNTSLYELGDKFRYVEYRLRNKMRSYSITSISSSQYLEKLLKKAQNGAYIKELTEELVSNKISFEEAFGFVNSVIDSQALVSELEPTITGTEFFNLLIDRLSQLNVSNFLVGKLIEIRELLNDQSINTEKYFQITQIIKDYFTKTNNKDLIQTDLFYNFKENTIQEKVVQNITQQIDKLFALARKNTNQNLEDFKRKFYDRYEEQEVPLLIALDSELGIGYATSVSGRNDNLPLLDGLALGKAAAASKKNWSKSDKLVFEKYIDEVIKKKQTVVQLSDEDLKVFENENANPTIPDSFYVFGSLLSEINADTTENFKLDLKACFGPSAANLLGRFCHGNQQLTDKVKECLAHEEAHNKEAIYAEVIHLPEARMGNILLRPKLRNHEIPYLGNTETNDVYTVSLDDIMVSVKYGSKIILRSKKHNKIIIPRLTSAHNYSRGLVVYKFLCDLQNNGLNNSIDWLWGVVSEQTFLPRVEYKNIILSKAQWKISTNNFPELKKSTADYVKIFGEITQKYNLPQIMVLAEGDNELLIDMNNHFSLKVLAHKLSKRSSIILTEFLAEPNNCFVKDNNQVFTNEIIIPYYKKIDETKTTKPLTIKNITTEEVKRSFTIGSEWLYFKIYTGTKTADKILTEVVKPMVEQLKKENLIDSWFFIRYRDPDEHIRLRFHHATNPIFYQEVIKGFYEIIQKYTENGLVHKVLIDTYNREIERYGQETIHLSEAIFNYDSDSVVGFLDLLDGDAGEKYRWLLALRASDMLLDDFGLSMAEKFEFMKERQESFTQEFGGSTNLRVQLNDKYRLISKEMASFMNEANDETNEIEEAIWVFKHRSLQNAPIIDKIKGLVSPQKLFNSLLPSYLHMFLNRIFISNQRTHELVIYHYLSKYYESSIAREKAKNKDFSKAILV